MHLPGVNVAGPYCLEVSRLGDSWQQPSLLRNDCKGSLLYVCVIDAL
jgi:hypothetical protein